MIDWNQDGKYDWKDDAFYFNVVSEEGQKKNKKKPKPNRKEKMKTSMLLVAILGILAFGKLLLEWIL